MDISIPSEYQHRAFCLEFRVCVASTTCDVSSERAMLNDIVFPEIRGWARNAGIIFRESDPRWEAVLEPDRMHEIAAAYVEHIRAYHPAFICIIGIVPETTGSGMSTEVSEYPWLHHRAGGVESGVTLELIECVLGDAMMRDRAFFYVGDLVPAGHSRHADEALPQGQSAALVQRIRENGYHVREGVPNLKALAHHLRTDLLTTFQRLHPQENWTALEHERRLHEQFARSHHRGHFRIESYYDRLEDHLFTERRPLIVTGSSGGGKSALLANWVSDVRIHHPGMPVICHYVGAVSTHENYVVMLRHLLAELKEICGIEEAVPTDADELMAQFPLWLAQVRHERLLIVLDGLNQLGDDAIDLNWLPRRIPANITLVISVTTPSQVAQRLALRKWPELQLKPLTMAQSRAIIDLFVQESGANLESDILHQLSSATIPAITPFFLRTRAHGARLFGQAAQQMEMPGTETPEGLMESLLERYEHLHGRELVGDVLSFLGCARIGLSRDEIGDLMHFNRPAVTQFLGAFDFHLMERDGLLTFVHEHVRLAVKRRYGLDGECATARHRELGGYFALVPISLRRLDEEPWQWLQAQDHDHLVACISDISMLLAFCKQGRQHELRGYWIALNNDAMMYECYQQSFANWESTCHDLAEQAHCAEHLGQFLAMSGQFAGAENYLQLALRLKQNMDIEPSINIADTMCSLGEILRSAGKFDQAEEAYSNALHIREKLLDAHHPAIAQVLGDLGLLNRDRGRYQLALQLYQRALELREQAYGPHHPATAESLNNLALLYYDLKKSELAIPLYKRALVIRLHHFGGNHPAVATLHNNLGGCYHDIGDLDGTETNYRKALVIRERMLGPNHPYTLESVLNIAALLFARKDYHESRAMFERAITITGKTLGREHPDAITLNINYAQLLRAIGKPEAAEALLRSTLEIATRVLGKDHPLAASCANNLAVILGTIGGRDDEVVLLYERAIAGWEASYGPEHPYIGNALHMLAEVRIGMGDVVIAGGLLQRALVIRARHYGQDHQRTVWTSELLARITSDRAKFE